MKIFVEHVRKTVSGQHPWEYARDADGDVYRKNKAGLWVRLDPEYREHKRLYANGVRALSGVVKGYASV